MVPDLWRCAAPVDLEQCHEPVPFGASHPGNSAAQAANAAGIGNAGNRADCTGSDGRLYPGVADPYAAMSVLLVIPVTLIGYGVARYSAAAAGRTIQRDLATT